MNSDEVDILLAEDNLGDVHLVERAFEERDLPGKLHTVQTGDEALDWFYQRGEFPEAPRPDLVLMDLNLPATSGHKVLEEVKHDPDLKRIPVIIVTGSQSEDDLINVYERHANAVLTKPVDPDVFADQLELLTKFWVSTAALPPSPENEG